MMTLRKTTIPAALAMTIMCIIAPTSVMRAAGPVTVTKVTSPEKALRFEVTVPGSVDDVWNAFTTKEGLGTWLWRDVRVDLRAGGDWLAIFPTSTAGGTIVSIEPKHRLVISAMAPDTFPTVRRERTTATFELQAMSATSTKVTLTQTGWKVGAEWDAAYDYLADGNAELLTQLYTRFVSGPIAWPKMPGR